MPELSMLLQQIDEKLAEFNALRPLKPEDEDRLWQKLRLEWNYNSNHIEGNTLTYGETRLLVIFGKTTGGHEFREYSEMKAHDSAIFKLREMAQDGERPLSESDIRMLNEIILVESFWTNALTEDGQPTTKQVIPGQYKTTPNTVRLKTGEKFYFTSPAETPAQMHDLIAWYRANEDRLHPVVLAAQLHYRFVRIHPFDDGNGRVARLLMNYHLLRKGYLPIVIKSADKDNYLTALALADSGEVGAFVRYVARQVFWSLDLSIRAGKGESVEEMGDWEKEVTIIGKRAAVMKTSEAVNNLIKERIFDSIIPLIEKIDEKTVIFNKLFRGSARTINIYYDQKQHETSIDGLPQIIKDIFRQSKLTDIQLLEFRTTWQGNIVNPIKSLESIVWFRFTNETYRVSLSKPYNEISEMLLYEKELSFQFSIDEIGSLTNDIGKEITQELKNGL